MRKATFAKLSLTAAVGLGTLLGQAGSANAETPPKQLDQTGDIVFVPAPPTTIKPIPADPYDPTPGPDADFPIQDVPDGGDPDPCPQISCDLEQPQPGDEPECHPLQLCTDEKAPVPDDDPDPECNPQVLCDEITSDPGCNWTHGCPEEPECPEIQLNCDLTSDGGGDEGTDGGDEGTDDGGDESTTGGDESTTGGDESTTGGGSGGSLPKTGAEMATWAIAGLGLTGAGAALRKLGKRA